MNPWATLTPSPFAPAADIARWLDAILAPLTILIADRFRIIGPWTIPLITRLTRANRQLAAVLARLAAGCRARPRGPRPGRPSRGGPPAIDLPMRHGWLVAILRHEAAAYRSQLEFLLHTPGTAATLAASPAAVRALRPVCRLLAVRLPPALDHRAPPAATEAPPADGLIDDFWAARLTAPSAPPPIPPTPEQRNARPPPPARAVPRLPLRGWVSPEGGCYCAHPSLSPRWPFPPATPPPDNED